MIFNQRCPPSSPYCYNGACSDKPTTDIIPSTSIACTSEGFYPDQTNCSIYYYCPSQAAKPSEIKTYVCPSGYHFDVTRLRCVAKWLFKPKCKSVCRNHRNKFIRYPPSPAYYVYCSATGLGTIFKCADSSNQEFNTQTLQCEFKCRKHGYFRDATDCTFYYFCYRSFLKLRASHLQCPQGYHFDGTRCKKGPCISNRG